LGRELGLARHERPTRHLPDRDAEIADAIDYAQRAAIAMPPIPDDRVKTVTLDRHNPTPLP
jgi:hypothetical protein